MVNQFTCQYSHWCELVQIWWIFNGMDLLMERPGSNLILSGYDFCAHRLGRLRFLPGMWSVKGPLVTSCWYTTRFRTHQVVVAVFLVRMNRIMPQTHIDEHGQKPNWPWAIPTLTAFSSLLVSDKESDVGCEIWDRRKNNRRDAEGVKSAMDDGLAFQP